MLILWFYVKDLMIFIKKIKNLMKKIREVINILGFTIYKIILLYIYIIIQFYNLYFLIINAPIG